MTSYRDLCDLANEVIDKVKDYPVTPGSETNFLLRQLLFFIIKAWIITGFLILYRK